MMMQKILVALGGLAILAGGYYSWGWAGVFAVTGAILMSVLITFSRMMRVLRAAANRPVGYVDSAVMLNARLRRKLPLLKVLAMTGALGQAQSPADQQPEIFRWTDSAGSSVTCEFFNGKLVKWELARPAEPVDAPPAADATA